MDAEDFGKRLKLLRVDAEVSVERICKSIKVSENTYYKYEKGTSLPDAKIIVDICSVLVCDANKLLGYANKNTGDWSEFASLGARIIDQIPLTNRRHAVYVLGALYTHATVKKVQDLTRGIDIDEVMRDLAV